MERLGRGSRIGPLVLEAPLASGGMGAVYRARRDDGAAVAVKLMLAGAAASDVSRRRFEREAELAARLSHPGIVKVHLASRCKAHVDAFHVLPTPAHGDGARRDLRAALAELREQSDWHVATAALSLASMLESDALSVLAGQLEQAVAPRRWSLVRTGAARVVLLARRSGARKEELLPLLDDLLRHAERRQGLSDAFQRSFAALVTGARADAVTVTELADQLTVLVRTPP